MLAPLIGILWVSVALGASSPTIDAGDSRAARAAATRSTASGLRADLPVVSSWVVGGPQLVDHYCTGLGWHGGLFWVMGSDLDGDGVNGNGDNAIYFYDQAGGYLGGFPQPTLDQWGWRDSGYEGTHLLFGASGPHAGDVFWVNVNTLAVDYQVSGCPWETCRGIAITNVQAGVITYKVADLDEDIATMQWAVGPGAAQLVSQCPTPATAFGLAFDGDLDAVWVTTADGSGQLHRIDRASCALQQTLDLSSEVAVFGGAVIVQTTQGCNLWTLCQCEPNDRVIGWQSDSFNPYACSVIPVEPVTWGALKARYRD
jgi:hypothetical protein